MTREIPLTQGRASLVDDEDYDLVMDAGPWHVTRDGYAVHGTWIAGRCETTGLHTLLTGWALVDHINLDGLDNRRVNLRPATKSQNGQNRAAQANNTSGFKGVTRHKQTRKWQAQITRDGRFQYLGLFPTPEDAALAYDAAAIELHGEFARLNFAKADS